MKSKNTANTSDLLVKLTRLEDQVATLSSQLELDKITIGQLQQSLTDRDSQISELESKLVIAQNSLRHKTSVRLYQTREQLMKGGADTKIVSSVLGHIQEYIELVQGFVDEVQTFIHQKYVQGYENFKAALYLLQQAPHQTYGYFQKQIVDPADILVKKAIHSADSNYQLGRQWLEQELIDPGMALLDRIIFVAHELPLDARLFLQIRVIDPAITYLESLPTVINGVWVDMSTWIKKLMRQLIHLLKQSWDYIEEQIKQSSFWDGKQRMQGAT